MTVLDYLTNSKDGEVLKAYCDTMSYCLGCKFCADDVSCILLKKDLTIEQVKGYAEIAEIEMRAE